MRSPGVRFLISLVAFGFCAFAQDYNGPPPDEADVPFLLHAENLIPMERAEARQEERKKEMAYVIAGAASTARTPLAEPIFIMKVDELEPQKMQLFRMEVVKGQRETAFPIKRGKRTPRARYLTFRKLDQDLYWIETNEWLENGQYCLTPRDSNAVFCFEVY